MTQTHLLLLKRYAACGLVLAVAAHLLALAGFRPGGNALFIALSVGTFPAFAPAFLLLMTIIKSTRPSGWSGPPWWTIALAGCPPWMRYMTYGIFVYAIACNFVVMAGAPLDRVVTLLGERVAPSPEGLIIDGEPTIRFWRLISCGWLVFYSFGLAILTTAHQRGISNLAPKCQYGHSVFFGDKFCSTCGTPVTDETRSSSEELPR
jgi:hypothetical protein